MSNPNKHYTFIAIIIITISLTTLSFAIPRTYKSFIQVLFSGTTNNQTNSATGNNTNSNSTTDNNTTNDSAAQEQTTSDTDTSNSATNETATPTDEPIIYDDFTFRIEDWWYQETAADYSAKIVENYAVSGRSLRMELRASDPIVYGSKRSELALKINEQPAEEHIYKVSILLPDGGPDDYLLDPLGSEIITQWHSVPDEGELYVYPPLALKTWGENYVLERAWDDAEITSTTQMDKKGYREKIELGSYLSDKGRFVDWEFRIKWGWKESQHPYIKVYKDNRLIQEIKGPNTTNDKLGNVMKIGIYKWDWAQDDSLNNSVINRRVIYYDNVIVY